MAARDKLDPKVEREIDEAAAAFTNLLAELLAERLVAENNAAEEEKNTNP